MAGRTGRTRELEGFRGFLCKKKGAVSLLRLSKSQRGIVVVSLTLGNGGQTCLERMSNEENYGYTLLEGTPLMELLEQNSEAMSAFDVGEYGRQCAENSYVSLSDHGYLDNSQDMPDLDYYCREELVEMIAGEWDKEHESDVSQEQGYSLSSEQRDMSKAKDALANEGRDMEQMRATDAR